MGRNGTAREANSIINSVNASIKNEDVLGFQTYWTLRGTCVDTEEFKLSMEANGISRKSFRPQTNKIKFIDVIGDVAKQYGTEARQISACNGRVIMKLLKVTAHVSNNECDSTFEFEQDTTIIFDANKGNPVITGEGVEEIINEVSLRFASYLDKTSTKFIRLTFTDLLRQAGAVSMRDSGGIYFVPVASSEIIEGIKNLTIDFNLGTVYQLRLPSGFSEKQGVRDSVINEVKQRLKHYINRVERVSRPSTLNDDTKKQSIKTKAKKDIKDLFDLYSDILSESVNVSSRQAEKDAMFAEARVEYEKLELAITEKITDLEKNM